MLALLSWLLAGILAARTGAGLWQAASSWDGLPKWDMAKYGAAGARLAHAVDALDPLDFARGVGGLDLWGPVFPLIETTAFLPFGSTYRTAAGEMAVLFALTVLAGFWAGRQVAGVGGEFAGALVAAAVAASPAFLLFGTLVMTRSPERCCCSSRWGATRARCAAASRADFTLACIAAVLLFFLKFNYGLAWLVPFVLAEIWLAAGSPAALRARAAAHVRAVDWRRPWPIFLLAAAAGIVALALFGGRVNDANGQASRAISLGTPLYVLYVLVLIRALIRPRRSWARLKAWYSAAGPHPRAIVLVVLLPIALWMLAPSHARGFVRVLENRSAGPSLWTPAGALFYPRAFLHEFSPSVAVGAACLVLVALAVALWTRWSPPRRVVVFALGLGLAGTLAHPYKLTRFLFPLVPLLWLAAAATLAWAAGRLIAPRLRTVAAASAAAVVLVLALFVPIDRGRLAAGMVEDSVPAAVRPVAAAVAQAAAHRPRVRPGRLLERLQPRSRRLGRLAVREHLRGGRRAAPGGSGVARRGSGASPGDRGAPQRRARRPGSRPPAGRLGVARGVGAGDRLARPGAPRHGGGPALAAALAAGLSRERLSPPGVRT